MKSLITNNHLHKIGGSETAAYALAVELKRLGHSVKFFTFNHGIVSAKMQESGIRRFWLGGNDLAFDLILASHNTTIKALRAANVTGVYVNICHGTIPKLEQPEPGCNWYVGISEEVTDHITEKYEFSSAVHPSAIRLIRNGVDLERFKSMRPINPQLLRVLSLCHGEKVNKLLTVACKSVAAELRIVNKFKSQIWEIEREIDWADMVVSLGRGAIEAMAMGRSVLIADSRTYMDKDIILTDGVLWTKDEIVKSGKCNYSGRGMGWKIEREAAPLGYTSAEYNMIQHLSMHNPDQSDPLDYIREHHDIRKTAQQYLSLAK